MRSRELIGAKYFTGPPRPVPPPHPYDCPHAGIDNTRSRTPHPRLSTPQVSLYKKEPALYLWKNELSLATIAQTPPNRYKNNANQPRGSASGEEDGEPEDPKEAMLGRSG